MRRLPRRWAPRRGLTQRPYSDLERKRSLNALSAELREMAEGLRASARDIVRLGHSFYWGGPR